MRSQWIRAVLRPRRVLTPSARISRTASKSSRRKFLFFSSRSRNTRFSRDWSSDVCSSDLLPRLQNADVDADLREVRVAFETCVRAEVSLAPERVARVQDEPAVPLRHEPGIGLAERRLGDHVANLPARATSSSCKPTSATVS